APAEAPAANPPAAAAPAEAAPAEGAAPAEAATAEAAPTAEDQEEAQQKAVWEGRDKAVNESNTLPGGVGLLKTQRAQSGAPGQLRIGFVGEWFSAGFLCTSTFPC